MAIHIGASRMAIAQYVSDRENRITNNEKVDD